MLDIQINNQSLVIDDISLDFDMNNPAIKNEEGSVVYSFDVPDDEKKINAGIINHKNRIAAKDEYQDLYAKVFFNGRKYFEGRASFLGMDNDRLKFEIYFSTGNLNKIAKERRIRELNILNVTFDNEEDMLSYIEAEKDKEWPNAKFTTYQVTAENFLPDDLEADLNYNNASSHPSEDDEINGPNGTAKVKSVTTSSSDSGSLTLTEIDGYFTGNDTITFGDNNNESADVVSFNDYYRYPQTLNKEDGSGNLLRTLASSNNRALVVPFFYLPEVLYTMINDLGYRVNDRFFAFYSDFSQINIFNIFDVNGGIYDVQDDLDYTINSSMHLPDITYAEFIDALYVIGILLIPCDETNEMVIIHLKDVLEQTSFHELPHGFIESAGVYEHKGIKRVMKIDDNDPEIQGFKDLDDDKLDKFKGAVNTLNDVPEVKEQSVIYYIIDKMKYYQFYSYSATSDLGKELDLWLTTESLNPDQEISAEISPINTVSGQGKVGYKAKNWNDITLRVAFGNGTFETSNYWLFFGKTKGLVNQFLCAETDWRIRRRKVTLLMPTVDDYMLSRIHEKFSSNHMQYLVEQVRGKLQKDGRDDIEMDVYTI